MTFAAFIIGLIIMLIGFTMVWRTNKWEEYFGSFAYAIGVAWLSWKAVGIILLVAGFLVTFGLVEAFLSATLGRLIAPDIGR